MSLNSMLRSTVTLQRKTTTKDASGGPVDTFANVAGAIAVPCDVQPASANTRQRFARMQQEVDFSIYLSQDIGATSTDRLVDDAGNLYLVVEGGYTAGGRGYLLWPTMAHCKRLT